MHSKPGKIESRGKYNRKTMIAQHELKEGILTFTPARTEGGQLMLCAKFTSNNTGAKYERLLSHDEIAEITLMRDDNVTRRVFAVDPELIMDVLNDQTCIGAIAELSEHVDLSVETKLGLAARVHKYTFTIRIDRECEGESGLGRELGDLRRHVNVLSRKIDALQDVVGKLAIELFKKENTRKSEDGEITLAGIQLLAAAGVDLGSFGFDWICKIARAAVRINNVEICPAIIAAARKFDVNTRLAGSRETLLHSVIAAGNNTDFIGHQAALILVEGLIAQRANPRLICDNTSALTIMDRRPPGIVDGNNPHHVNKMKDVSKIHALLREAP